MSEWSEESTQIREMTFSEGRDRILVADSDEYRRMWLKQAVGSRYIVEEVDNARSALDQLTSNPPLVLVVGSTLLDVSGGVLLAHAARYGLVGAHKGGPMVFLLADTPETAAQVNEQEIPVFYRLTPQLQPERLRELLEHAIARNAPQAPRASAADTARTRQILEYQKKLGALSDVTAAAVVATSAIVELICADRARCLYYDDERGVLWSETDPDSAESQASAGVAGFVARAGSPVVLEKASSDPAYRAHVDDPEGNGNERLCLMPVIDRDRRVHAVLIAVRAASSPPFTQVDMITLSELAAAWAPYVHQLSVEAEAGVRQVENRDEIFRHEAIQNLIKRGSSGDVVRVHPRWINAAFWVVVLAVGSSVGFAAVARVHQYAQGPSVVRVTGRTDVIAYDGGSVTGIEVSTGQAVVEGQILIRLHDNEQANQMRGLDSEFERKLVAYLQSPTDHAVRESLSGAVSARDKAKASLDARVIRAPHDGVVRDVLVNIGQRVDAGKVVVAVAKKGVPEGLSVLAFVAGSERPRLTVGQSLRLTLPGYRGAKVVSTVRAISSEVIGAPEAKARYLTNSLADSLQIDGTVVVVEAQLPPTFEADGQVYELHDGMVGHAEVQLESKTVLETVVPGLAE